MILTPEQVNDTRCIVCGDPTYFGSGNYVNREYDELDLPGKGLTLGYICPTHVITHLNDDALCDDCNAWMEDCNCDLQTNTEDGSVLTGPDESE